MRLLAPLITVALLSIYQPCQAQHYRRVVPFRPATVIVHDTTIVLPSARRVARPVRFVHRPRVIAGPRFIAHRPRRVARPAAIVPAPRPVSAAIRVSLPTHISINF